MGVVFLCTCMPVAFCDNAELSISPNRSTKQSSTFYHARARQNAIVNAKRYAWAAERVAQAVAEASDWIAISDDELWRRIFGHDLHRALTVNRSRGCPIPGSDESLDIGDSQWAWIASVPGHPWKIMCPANGMLFPTNDFGAFYESGISPQDGFFHYDLADRSLLYNSEHPDPADPLHTWGVDDGRGWQRFPGGLDERDWYVGYHVLAGYWRATSTAMRSLAEAYALTSNPVYAHKCAILLDRLADEFPNYNGREQFFSPGSGYWPGIIGPDYWEGGSWEQRALDYDKIFDGLGEIPETLQFLRAKSHQYRVPLPKESIEDIRYNIEERILRGTLAHPDRIDMNGTQTQSAMATVDFVLRGFAAVDQFIEKTLPALVPSEHINADGSGNERALGYDSGSFNSYCTLMERLATLSPDLAREVLDRAPRLRASFDFWLDLLCLDKFLPNIGDTGDTGVPWGPAGTAGGYLVLYDLTGQIRYAQAALRLANNDPAQLPRNIFTDDPEGLVQRAIIAATAAAALLPPSVVKADFQIGLLRAGQGAGRVETFLFYSPKRGTSSHSHFDALNVGLYANGIEAIVEQAYPLHTGGWPSRWEWTSHTRSHATVTIDGQCQNHCEGGTLLGFAGAHGVQMVAAEAPCVYDNASRYRRVLLLVQTATEEVFVVDVFHVAGGSEHTYTLPFYYGETEPSGIVWHASQTEMYGGYLENARIGSATGAWHVDIRQRSGWEGEPVGCLRVHGASGGYEIILAEGETRLGHDAPQRLPYLLLRNRTNHGNLVSTFVSVWEPYQARPSLSVEATVVQAASDPVDIDVSTSYLASRYRFRVRGLGNGVILIDVEKTVGGTRTEFTLHGVQGESLPG